MYKVPDELARVGVKKLTSYESRVVFKLIHRLIKDPKCTQAKQKKKNLGDFGNIWKTLPRNAKKA